MIRLANSWRARAAEIARLLNRSEMSLDDAEHVLQGECDSPLTAEEIHRLGAAGQRSANRALYIESLEERRSPAGLAASLVGMEVAAEVGAPLATPYAPAAAVEDVDVCQHGELRSLDGERALAGRAEAVEETIGVFAATVVSRWFTPHTTSLELSLAAAAF
ncbi:MAG: hypothetical protein QGG36_01000 [Pirellulaceae bacterium]|jgi:hypothetical protein|nr:hypothetical protein [Pirellulaceae bacterium]MDP7014354.1 hypothetical protein [Pirellulaceae bacterium]